MGLPSGLKWATCNVGASSATDGGLLFQWGRVDGYRYGDENHKFRTYEQNTQDTGNENIPITTSGKTYNAGDSLETYEYKDDAARVNMGGNWRTPTCSYNEDTSKYEGELAELLDNTTKDNATINGIDGTLFTSKINGHQLFIPFSGYWSQEETFVDNEADIWSSQVHSSNINYAYGLYCYSGGYADVSNDNRTYAFSVRGVFQV